MSGLYRYIVEFMSEDSDLDFSQIVGKEITIEYDHSMPKTHFLSGIVGRFVHLNLAEDPHVSLYQAEVHPWLWLTTMNAGCQIFQQKSTPDIVSDVFSNLGFPDHKSALSSSYDQREYCVQYNETSFAFVSRLMEEEGIFYFFTHDASGHKMVIADSSNAFIQCPNAGTIRVSHHKFQHEPTLWDCTIEQQVTVGEYKSDEYNFETPATDLLAAAKGAQTAHSIYEYPGNLLAKGKAEARSKLVLEAFQTGGKILRGSTGAPTFRPGYKFKVEGHARRDVNTTWVIRSVSFRFDQEGEYSGTFEAFPLDVPYRPPRSTPRPRIAGAQTATVVGKAGDENSSCWVRVAQGWAGKKWGIIFIPRIDQEVVVSFLEGDPDRPLITGCVYNGTQTVPYDLPGEQTKSTIKSNSSKGGGGFNEFRFEDKKDSEEIFLHAQKDYNITVLNNQTSTIKKNRKTTVQEEHDELIVSKGNRTIKVETGKETHSVKDTRSVTVTGDETHKNDANFDQNVTKNYTLKVQGNIVIEATGSISIKAGTELKTEAGTSMTQKSGTDFTNDAGTNMTNKAKLDMNNQALNLTNQAKIKLAASGVTIESKASAMQTVEAGGILGLKGAMVKLN
jgi:type VI secretion system secreted protein VgrG